MGCVWLGLLIFASVMLYTDYDDYRHGGKSWFFKSNTEIEKLNDENRLLEAQIKNAELKQKVEKIDKADDS